MKKDSPEIPRKTIYRLSVYLRCLARLKDNNIQTVSSEALAKVAGVKPTYLYQPTGIAMSPDFTKFYVSSSQLNQVVAYDYDRFTGTATNPTIFADASDGLSFPNDIQFSPNGSKIYVANLNGGVSQFLPNGTSAGGKLLLPTSEGTGVTQTSSMNFLSDGRLLAGCWSI